MTAVFIWNCAATYLADFCVFRAFPKPVLRHARYSSAALPRRWAACRSARGLLGSSYTDTGLFGVYAGTSAKDASELVSVIAGEMKSLAEGAGEDEVIRARAQIKSGLLMGLEQASARCEQMAAQYLTYGRLIDARELIAKINAIDTAAVSRIAAKVLASGPLSLAALGPMGNLGSYDRIAQRFQ